MIFLTFPLLPVILQDYRNPLSFLTWPPQTVPRASVDGARLSLSQPVWESRGGHGVGFSREKSHGSWRAPGPDAPDQGEAAATTGLSQNRAGGVGWLSVSGGAHSLVGEGYGTLGP